MLSLKIRGNVYVPKIMTPHTSKLSGSQGFSLQVKIQPQYSLSLFFCEQHIPSGKSSFMSYVTQRLAPGFLQLLIESAGNTYVRNFTLAYKRSLQSIHGTFPHIGVSIAF